MKTDALKSFLIVLFSFSFQLCAIVEHEVIKADALKAVDEFFSALPNVRLARTREENDRLKQQHAVWIAQYESRNYDPKKNILGQTIVYVASINPQLLKEINEKLSEIKGVILAPGLTVDDKPKNSHMIGSLMTPDRKTTHIFFVAKE